MKTVKQIMAEGRAAYKNTRGSGLRDKLNPYTSDPNALYDEADDWRRGWDQAHRRRMACFERYIEVRDLFDRRYAPPGQERRLKDIQQQRQTKIDRLVREYPDFPVEFEKHQARKAEA